MEWWQVIGMVIAGAITTGGTVFGALATLRARRADQRAAIALAQISERKEIKLKSLEDTGRHETNVFKAYEDAIKKVPELFGLIESIQRAAQVERIENVTRYAVQKAEIDRLTAAELRCQADLGAERTARAVLSRDFEALQQAMLGTTAPLPRTGPGLPPPVTMTSPPPPVDEPPETP